MSKKTPETPSEKQLKESQQKLLDEHFPKNPSENNKLACLAEAYFDHNMRDEALKLLDQVIKADSGHLFALERRGDFYRQCDKLNDNLKMALADLTAALVIKSDSVYALESRGSVYRQQGLFKEALTDLTHDVFKNTKSSFVLGNRCSVYRHLDKLKESLADSIKALAFSPKNILALQNRGIVYRQLGNLDAALKDIERSLVLSQRFISGNEFSVNERKTIKKLLVSRDELLEENFPGNYTENDKLACCAVAYFNNNMSDRAFKLINQVIEIDNHNYFALQRRGGLLPSRRQFG